MAKTVKIILAGLLFLCLLDMPYGYYQFVRLAATASFLYLAYITKTSGQGVIPVVYFLLALLFQPIIMVSFEKEIWNVIDVIVAIGLLVTLKKKDI